MEYSPDPLENLVADPARPAQKNNFGTNVGELVLKASADSSAQNSKISYIENLVRRGLKVHPLRANLKTPLLKDFTERATDNVSKLHAVFDYRPDLNIGILTGTERNGKFLFVLDVDNKPGKDGDKSLRLLETIYDELPRTFTNKTGNSGRHLFFWAVGGPPRNSVGKIAEGIDVRGYHGYVVGPGSVVDGRHYETIDDSEIALAPEWLCDLLQTKSNTSPHVAPGDVVVPDLDTPDAIRRATEWLKESAPEAVEGNGGDNATIAVINRVGDFGVSEAAAYDLLLDHWNDTKATPPWDPDDLRAKVRSAYKSRQNPIGIRSPEAEFEAVEIDSEREPTEEPTDLWAEDAPPPTSIPAGCLPP